MTPQVREAMADAAVRAARAIGYKGAGTVEFIVDASDGLQQDRFWFMDMNTRLQVEHPVTEAVTGIDLVEWQLRVAAGQSLPLRQDQIALNGHAFEARLYAEDAQKGCLPAIGLLDHLVFAQEARIESGVRTGDAISPYYDPMSAKVITHGPDRATALARLRLALDNTQVAGVVTNRAFLAALADHAGFAAGLQEPAPDAGFALWPPLARRVVLCLEDAQFSVTIRVHKTAQRSACSLAPDTISLFPIRSHVHRRTPQVLI